MPLISIPAANLSFDCPDDDTIMRAAVRNGLGFPYECNVGSCGNCKFELLEGEIEHLRQNPPGWSERDLQRKRYLGCQAKPLSDCKIKLNLRDHYKSHILPRKVSGKLMAVHDLTHDLREFQFALDVPVAFLPGQYALLSVPGIEGARAYSMGNITDDGKQWHFQIKRVPNGLATSALFDRLKLGDEIGLDGPYGMAYLREEAPRDLLLIAGGSGLSPMISLTRGAAASTKLNGRQLHFFYGGRTASDMCADRVLGSLPGYGTNIHYYPAISMPETDGPQWSGRTGFIHDYVREAMGDKIRDMEIYFAGPPAMAEAVTRMIVEYKVPMAQVHFDQFY